MTEEWVETTLGQVADYVNGYPFKPTELSGSRLPVIRIKQLLDPSANADFTDVEVPDKVRLSNGDLVFSWSGSLASRIWDRGPAALNQHLFRVLERPGVSRGWLHLALDHAVEELMTKTHGTTMKHVTKRVLESHPVLLPPLPVQLRITDLMAYLDGHLANLQAERQVGSSLLAQLREMLSAASDPVPLGELAAVDGIQIGPFGSQLHASDYVEVGIPVVMPRDITEGQISSTKIKQVAPETAARLSRHQLLPGDIVFPRRGDLSKRALVTAEQAGWLCGTGCIRFRPSPGVDGGQVFQALSGERATAWLVEHAVGTTMLNLNTQILTSLPVPDPRVGESPVAAACEGLADLLAMLATEERRLLTIRGALLSSLLSGAQAIETTYDTLLPEAS